MLRWPYRRQLARFSSCQAAYLRSVASDVEALQKLYQSLASDANVARNLKHGALRLLKCHEQQNRVYVTGMGKSAAVAQRLASTLSSISISSQWIHGAEWVHGELGGLKSGDIVVILSHSGQTPELLPLPGLFRKAGCSALAIVGNNCSPLSKHCDLSIVALAQDEVHCPVPSRSIIVQESICNALVQELIETMDDSGENLRESHPGGAIGVRFAN